MARRFFLFTRHLNGWMAGTSIPSDATKATEFKTTHGFGYTAKAASGETPVSPSAVSAPVVTGDYVDGSTLTATTGVWNGSGPISYAYQWLRDGVAIAGAVLSSYVVTQADLGPIITVRVTASNSAGSASSVSQGGSGLLKVPYATNYNAKDHNLYASLPDPAKTSGKVLGVDYDAVWSVNTALFPNNIVLDWFVPEGPIPNFGVWGYHHLDKRTITPTHVANLTTWKTDFAWAFTGSNNFNLLDEFWVGRSPISPVWNTDQSISNASYAEVGVFLHCPEYSFHNGGELIGEHQNEGVLYTCRLNGRYITFATKTQTDVLIGSFDRKAALVFLVNMGVLTGSEWIAGYAPLFGIEPVEKSGSATHGGRWSINSLATTMTAIYTPLSADYHVYNDVTNPNTMTGWDLVGASLTTGVTDIDGGTTAAYIHETNTDGNHGFIKSGSFITVPSREMEYTLFEDVKADLGRTKFQMYIASGDFVSQIKNGYDTVALTAVSDSFQNSQVASVYQQRQIIDLGNGWRRLISVFRKQAGVTQIFYNFLVKNDAGSVSYAGDVTKGFSTAQKHRLVPSRKMSISGTLAAATSGTAYSSSLVLKGGAGTISYSISSGSLPSGLAIASSTGLISGTPSALGTSNFTVRATQGDGTYVELATSISVDSIALTSFEATGVPVGVSLSESNRRVTATGANLGAKSTSSRAIGSAVQAEIEVIAINGGMNIGLGNSAANLSAWLGASGNGICIDTSNGKVYMGGNELAASGIAAITAGQRVGLILPAGGGVRFKVGSTVSPIYAAPTGPLSVIAQPNAGAARIHTEASTSTVALEASTARWN